MKKYHEFKCDNCGNRWTEYTDEVIGNLLCLQCNSTRTRRVISAPMVGGETPYKTLEKSHVPGNRIVSGPHYRSR